MNQRPLLRFNPNGSFKIMQISDVQDVNGVGPRTKQLLCTVLDQERPDFVVFTGDQIKGYGAALWFGSQQQKYGKIRKTLRELLDLLESRGIPFTFVFGNHDHDAPMPEDEQVRLYQQSLLCYAQESPAGVPGFANHVVPVYPREGDKPAMLIYCLDSHGGLGLGYAPLKPEQVDWYRAARDEWAAQNGGQPVPSLLFQHVPLEEINELYSAVPRKTKGALEGYRNYAGKYFILNEEIAQGFMGELPSTPDTNAGLFDAAKEKGEMLGMFFGHDHTNGFHGLVRGIQLGYAPSAGYNAYGPGRKRGVRVLNFEEGKLAAFTTKVITDEELLGDSPLPHFNRIYDMTPSSFGAAKPLLRGGLVTISAASLVAAVAVAARKKK